MNKVLLFGGTGEGRALAEWMVARDIPHTVCVTTEYGETLLPAGAEAHVGRMDSGEMEALMRAGGYSLAVDATHPYAVEVTEHIRAAAEAAGLPNQIPCSVDRVIDSTFSTIVMLRTPGGGLLRYECEKDLWSRLVGAGELTVSVDPSVVMPLAGGGSDA